MELYEIKKQLKKEKTNYYDKNLFKRIFHILVGHPDIKLYKIMKDAKMYRFYKENHKSIFRKIKLIYFAKKLIEIQKNILLNYMENLEKICYYVMLL